MTVLAVDVGGTKVAAAFVDQAGAILAKTQQLTDLDGPEAVIAQVAALCRDLSAQAALTPRAIGVSVPAALASADTDRVLWAPNLPGWRDVPLREMLQTQFNLPAFLEFDGHAAALGEWWAGAGKGCRGLVSVIIGTGIGAGFVVEGQVWAGRDRLAGAVGWFPIAGPRGLDHWENLAAGPAIARRAQERLAAGEASSLNNGGELTAREVFAAARAGDALAQRVIQEAASYIGLGVASIISFANPEVVVLGGSVGQQGDLLLTPVREAVARWAQPISAEGVQIVSSQLGEEASLLGAAYTAYRRLSS